MRIAGHDEGIDADVLILADSRSYRFGIANECGAGAAARQSDTGPEVRADLEPVAASTVQLRHALLPDRIHPRKDFLRRGYGFVGDVLNQFVGGFPGFRIGLANDHMQPYPERELASTARCNRPYPVDLLGHLRRWFAPGQIFVDGIDGNVDARIRRSAGIKRRARRLPPAKKE